MGGLLDSPPTWACARLVELCTLQLKSDLARTLWRSPRALNAGPSRVTGDVIGTAIYLDFALASYEAYFAYSHKDPVYFGESDEAAISSDHRIPNPRFYIKQIMQGEDAISLAGINSFVKTLEASEPKNDSRNWRRELRSILIRIDYMLSESHKRNALLIKPLLTVLERLRDLAAGNDDKYMMRVIAWRSHRLAWLVDTEAQATLLPTSSAAVVTKSLRDRRRGLLRSDRVPSGVYNDFLAREWLHAHPSVMDRRGIFTDPMRWNNIPSRSLPASSELALLSEDSDWSQDYPLEYGAARNQRDIFSNESAWAESSLVSDESLNSQDVLSSDEREYNVMQPPVDASKTQPVRANARSEGVK
ncbi:hypothetical protein BDY17DRAFT_292825 [Neohortaea acidophila]|uniref:Uncharacterized protein n=1 Tax=Neohortaea acidophila TaxID=245834 RepID=A0A6A6PZ63_9PEZI|nr:uncharacterized protein BDY17DRAFT_292825 [Neohortaea acidophila]KAF2485041.1 hypothetical protein BDY17DRAFT_292825 [Neohortaea acidophila]